MQFMEKIVSFTLLKKVNLFLHSLAYVKQRGFCGEWFYEDGTILGMTYSSTEASQKGRETL